MYTAFVSLQRALESSELDGVGNEKGSRTSNSDVGFSLSVFGETDERLRRLWSGPAFDHALCCGCGTAMVGSCLGNDCGDAINGENETEDA